MESPHIIYGLLDPETQQLRYVGYTSNKIKRYSKHHSLKVLANDFSHKANWIKSLIAKGLKAEMMIIEEFATAEELPEAEIKYISNYRNVGYDLTNSTDGGEGQQNPSEETRKKMGSGQRGKPSPMKGKKHTAEAKQKMSESHKGLPSSWVGRKHTDEARKKQSESHIGKPSWRKGKTGFISKRRKLTNEQVKQIREEYKPGDNKTKIAEKYNIDRSCISDILENKIYKEVV